MIQSAHPFLMFQGDAKAALALYVEAIPGAAADISYHGPEAGEQQGKVLRAILTIAGQEFIVMDSPPVHAFTFTPSMSIFLEVDSVEQLDALVEKLGDGGAMLMPADDYGFSRRFCWLKDRFGLTWQINFG